MVKKIPVLNVIIPLMYKNVINPGSHYCTLMV